MRLDQLEQFMTVYRYQNYTSAARSIPMSPQGLSKTIKRLEKELGVTLFTLDTEKGTPVPTIYAHELIQFVRRWDEDFYSLQKRFETLRARENRVIRVGSSFGISGMMGLDFLKGFHAQYPGITAECVEQTDYRADEGLKQGEFDFALTVLPSKNEFATEGLLSERVCFWVHRSNPLSTRESFDYRDFDRQCVGIPGRDFKIYHRFKSECEANRVQVQDYYTSSEMYWLFDYALGGEGLSFNLPHIAALPVFQNPDVVNVPMSNMDWSCGISYLASHKLTEDERSFHSYCLSYAKELRSKLPTVP
ncbi:MAG: LysR family transcriptional regulator [Bifidobacteriaceae bacterium]|jgi:DNA-binding transcriptional LysR family regulator|nr:LysR family transcriptional regulator [Bifidobacteriaceae bacterium]